MSEHSFRSLPSDPSSGDALVLADRALDPAGRRATDKDTTDIGELLRFEQQQLEREYADIERASAALRLAQPELESWIKQSSPRAVAKSRPLWLLISILWLSTALVTAGTVAAIATLVG
jgi:hypothetical protein